MEGCLENSTINHFFFKLLLCRMRRLAVHDILIMAEEWRKQLLITDSGVVHLRVASQCLRLLVDKWAAAIKAVLPRTHLPAASRPLHLPLRDATLLLQYVESLDTSTQDAGGAEEPSSLESIARDSRELGFGLDALADEPSVVPATARHPIKIDSHIEICRSSNFDLLVAHSTLSKKRRLLFPALPLTPALSQAIHSAIRSLMTPLGLPELADSQCTTAFDDLQLSSVEELRAISSEGSRITSATASHLATDFEWPPRVLPPAVAFYSILEAATRGDIAIHQDEPFGPITINTCAAAM